jgi:hypothetical protein
MPLDVVSKNRRVDRPCKFHVDAYIMYSSQASFFEINKHSKHQNANLLLCCHQERLTRLQIHFLFNQLNNIYVSKTAN